MALFPQEILAERVRQFSDVKAERVRESLDFHNKVLLRMAERAIDAELRERYQVGTYVCRVVVETSLLTQTVRDALPKVYCGQKKWARMDILSQSHGEQTDIVLEC